jgi:hypothetical protein
VGLALALAVGGCGHARLEVESDTCWDGLINNNIRLSGCGNKKYDVTSGYKCAVLQKQTTRGYLRARLTKRKVWIETSDEFGLITVCD